jgi:phosphoribosylaminoimidazole-succinocarboxamide synthase
MTTIIDQTNLPLKLLHRGKVRDTYELGDKLLIVTTDRVSAFDVVLPTAIPDKGHVLNQISVFWFQKTAHIMPNHLITPLDDPGHLYPFLHPSQCPSYLIGRSMVVTKAMRLPVECVVRGYLAGSGWAEYKRTNTVCGIQLPPHLKENEQLHEPIFTPTTKADEGHDMPLTMKKLEAMVGIEVAGQLQEASMELYTYARNYALTKGIIIADTKFEFGMVNNKLILIDEMLTPDSSRFWEASAYVPGQSQPSFDKQPIRDYLALAGWNKLPPAPPLPGIIIEETTRRYREVYLRLTGKELTT